MRKQHDPPGGVKPPGGLAQTQKLITSEPLVQSFALTGAESKQRKRMVRTGV